MESQITLRDVTVATAHFVHLGQIPGDNFHSGADAVTITLHANSFDQHGIISVATIVAQQLRPTIQVVDDNVNVAIIIDVAEDGAPSYTLLEKRSTELLCHFGKRSITIILVNKIALAIAR